jgi:hypothetical protein
VNCEAFLDRLYDNDARAAGRGQGRIPPDMAPHMLTCDRCRAAYDAARADDLLLARALLEAPPPAWRAQVLRQVARSPQHASWSQRIAAVNEVVIWGILAVAASQVLLGQSSTAAYVAAFWAGGAAALLRPGMVKHWQVLRRERSALNWV